MFRKSQLFPRAPQHVLAMTTPEAEQLSAASKELLALQCFTAAFHGEILQNRLVYYFFWYFYTQTCQQMFPTCPPANMLWLPDPPQPQEPGVSRGIQAPANPICAASLSGTCLHTKEHEMKRGLCPQCSPPGQERAKPSETSIRPRVTALVWGPASAGRCRALSKVRFQQRGRRPSTPSLRGMWVAFCPTSVPASESCGGRPPKRLFPPAQASSKKPCTAGVLASPHPTKALST